MIRNNLSTRPFYNVAAVRFWLLVGGILVVAATAFNVVQVLRHSNSNTELVTRASNDEASAAAQRKQAAALRASVDAAQVDLVSVDARQANELIDRRHLLLDGPVQPLRADATRRCPHHVGASADRQAARDRADGERARAQRGRREPLHGKPRQDRLVSRPALTSGTDDGRGLHQSSLEMIYKPTPAPARVGAAVAAKTSATDAAVAGGAR